MTNYEEYMQRERGYFSKAIELLGDVPPQYNLAPLLSLIRSADSLGFDVVKRADGLCHMQPRPGSRASGCV